MRKPDNHVSVDIELIKNAAKTIQMLEEEGLEPSHITIQQTDVGEKGEFNLSYKLEGESE